MKQDITVLDSANQPSGPFTLQEVQQKLATGEFKPSQLAYMEGLSAWTPLSEVIAKLVPPTSPAPAPAPVSSPAPSFGSPSFGTPSFGTSSPSPTPMAETPRASSPAPSTLQPGIQNTYSLPPAGSSPLYGSSGGMEIPMMPGTFWKRFVAYFIDSLIIGAVLLIPNIIIQLIVKVIFGASPVDADGNPAAMFYVGLAIQTVILIILYVAAFAGYYGFTECAPAQASFGKRIFGLKVTNADGSPLTANAAAFRGGVKYLLISFTCCIGGFIALFTDQAKALHDMVCGTVVVEPRQ